MNIGCRAAGLLAVSLLAFSAQLSRADVGDRPRVAASHDQVNGRAVGILTVNDETAVILKTSAGGQTAAARIDAAAQRLSDAVAHGLAAGTVNPRRAAGRAWAVTADGEPLLLATPAEADAQKTTPEDLARRWTRSLRRLLSEPPLSLSLARIVVPLGETRVVSVGGSARAAEIVARDADPHGTQSVFDPARRTLTVRGLTPGQSTVQVAAAGGTATASLSVAVMKYAARIAPSVSVGVTGVPDAPPETVAQAVSSALSRAVDAEPTAQWHLLSTGPLTFSRLSRNAQTVLHLPVRATGDNLLTVEAVTTVTVVNQPVTIQPPGQLFYSNNPEQVKSAQTLFLADVPASPVRLDYHHQNMSGSALVFHVDLVNDTDGTATAQVMSGVAAPGQDTVQVGRRCGAAFLRAQNASIGVVLNVPPHTRVPLVTQRMPQGLTASGILQVQQMAGKTGALAVRVAADDDGEALASPLSRVLLASIGSSTFASPSLDLPPPPPGAVRPASSPYIFGSPLVTVSQNYAVGGQWAYIRLGHKDSLNDASGTRKLFGNYGVTYNITATLTNPTKDARPVAIFFAPEAGYAAGVFQVDGGPIQEYDPLPPPEEKQIARYVLAPGETRKVQIQTLPLNGSAYPASLVVHAL